MRKDDCKQCGKQIRKTINSIPFCSAVCANMFVEVCQSCLATFNNKREIVDQQNTRGFYGTEDRKPA